MELNEDQSLHASAVFNKYAKEYQDKFMTVSLYQDALNEFCKLITKANARLLDLACGPGNVTKYLLSRKPDFIIRGIDLAPNMVSLAKANNPGASFEVMDCRLISTLTEKFDAVVCAFCLPYLSQTETSTLISDINGLLNDGGICYISTMEDQYSKSGYEKSSKGNQLFIHYYEGEYLINELTKHDFVIIETFRIPTVMTNGKEVIDLVIISRKNNLDRT